MTPMMRRIAFEAHRKAKPRRVNVGYVKAVIGFAMLGITLSAVAVIANAPGVCK